MLRTVQKLAAAFAIAALLLPAILTVLPSPASAEEQALYRDLMVSRCLDGEAGKIPMPGMGSHGECCILGKGLPVADRAADVLEPVVFVAPVQEADVSVWFQKEHLPDPTHWLPLSRRGPPA
ncbi:MAG: hypothetical protein LCH46_03740 [Proteobacteria bacterium]|nr:hypothetical protein [Pseudomonadota bacterium]